jgi:hypothetical protein
MKLTDAHREILTTLGETDASLETFHRHGREFGELSATHLIVFWPQGGPRPATIYGGGTIPGRWYLTHAGAEAAELEPPTLRLNLTARRPARTGLRLVTDNGREEGSPSVPPYRQRHRVP